MTQPQPKTGQEIIFTIHGLGHSGEGVGHYHGYTIFVDGALPHEKVRVVVTDARKTYGFAKLIEILVQSPDRVKPPCPLFGKCGGCQIMHLSYAKQLSIKKQKVADALQRIGKIDPSIVQDCEPSPQSLHYRNKIQLPVKEGPVLGLYAKGSHQFIQVDHCLIHCTLGEEVFFQIKNIIKTSKIIPFDPKTGEGELRHILIRSAVYTNQVLVVLVTNQKTNVNLKLLADEIMTKISSVKGVIHNIHKEKDNVILGDIFETLAGISHIQERICDLTFSISAASFFQVNPAQAENLYLKALAFAEVKPTDTVLDAYCGVGTLSLIFAKNAKKVIGVECVKAAIIDAKANALTNKIENTHFVCESSEKFIQQSLPPIDILLLNPPRKGCDISFLQGIGKLLPQKIIYISCDPATLARDLNIIQSYGYEAKIAKPFDMFPQTSHVESVVLINKKT
jgi:23S rRNA (uracil1939-C5)-methyltransferase